MTAWFKQLVSSDEGIVSTLHFVLVWLVFLFTFPLVIVSTRAILEQVPFPQAAQSFGQFMYNYGLGLGSALSSVGAVWALKGWGLGRLNGYGLGTSYNGTGWWKNENS